MSSDTEVFIPEQARVITVPVHSLPASITRKMPVCPVQSDQLATFISPVELREKGTTHKPQPLTPGQFFLPVVASNHKACRILQKFLQSGENSMRFSEENSSPGSAFSKRKNSIILFNTQVFLIVRKAKASDWLRSSTPSWHKAPPLNSPVNTQCGGSDITEGRSEEATCGADGKDVEKRRSDEGDDVVTLRETQDDDITERGRSKDGAGAAEDHGKCVIKGREADVMKDGGKNISLTLTQDMSTNTPSVSERNRVIKLEEESGVSILRGEAQTLLANAQDQNGAENQITANFIQNSNPELTREQRRANETGLAAETQTGNENNSSDRWKHSDTETIISDRESLLAKAKCCKRLIFPTNRSRSLTNVNKLQDKSDAKEQTIELEINSDKMKVSVCAAEVADVSDDIQVSQIITKNFNDMTEDVANSTSSVHIQVSEGQRSRRESAVEIVDVNDDDDEMQTLAEETNASRDENLLGKSGKKKTDGRVSSRYAKQCKSDGIAMETSTECDDLIIVESCGEVESLIEGHDTEVVEVDGSSTDQPSRHASNNKHYVNKTSAKAKREVGKVASASDDAKSCESGVEIIDSDDDCVVHQSTNDANRDAASSKSGDGVKSRSCRSPSLKRCESAVEIVDLNKDDDVIVNNRNVNRHLIGDVAKGSKRRITDETDSGVAAAVRISNVSGLSAKRWKRDDDDDDDAKCPERDVNPNCQGKNFNHDAEIIEVDDDDDDDDEIRRSANKTDETCANEASILRNPGHAKGSADEVGCRNHDGELSDPRRRRRDAAERQSSVEKIKSCKRHVSRSDDTDDVESRARMNEAEDWFGKRFKSNANGTNPGKGREEHANNQISVRADDQHDLINNKNSSKAHVSAAETLLTTSDVEVIVVCDRNQLSRESSQEPNQDVTNSKNEVTKTINQTLSAAGPSSSNQNKNRGAACEITDVCDDTKQSVRNVESCVESHVSEVENKSAAETSDEQKSAVSDEQNHEVTNDGICVSETPHAAEARVAKCCDDELNRDETTSRVSKCESDVDDANVGKDKGLASASFTDKLSRRTEPQTADDTSPSATPECRESDLKRQAHQDREFADKQLVATNQSTPGEKAVDSLRPTSPRANQEFNYERLRREENISRLRARLQQAVNKLHAANKDAQELTGTPRS